jgi:hypothetical protein
LIKNSKRKKLNTIIKVLVERLGYIKPWGRETGFGGDQEPPLEPTYGSKERDEMR